MMKFLLVLFLITITLITMAYSEEHGCIPPFQPCEGVNSRCCGLYVCFNKICLATP
uniref:U-reduvitoxin-Pr2a n=1 Tax=Platymeris rhadamanthus TaxID=1134088 RepID=PLK2A_PLARH|nr:RecName: Full=U-reduvitoxin-Pr2a; Short=U-RDTX-Pr2a; Contains: RecName: Full=U-reduvitoxin-Pr2b; Short=U-RDTX-Pr2b; Flags: Precursor [Platymeris rhadamanthus]QHB21535.1 venom Ptu1 family peptide Pr2a [Platymeris rhadamanthus]